MADIELTLDGDASGATAALNETGEATGNLAKETGKSVVAWQLMADVATKAASAVVKFGVDAVKMYAEAERVQRQLTRAAGEYGSILGEQAEALSKVYAVDDDIIKQSYTLLTQWGGVGAATEETTKAVLNYAAATGTDAVTATQALIRNVESGGAGMAKMGIHFKETGKRGDDLAAAVGAINTKLAGAAEGDAKSLIGGARAAHLAFEDLQKSIGGMLSTALDKTGALGFITEKLREVASGASIVGAALERLPGFLREAVKGRGYAEQAILAEANAVANKLLHPASTALPDVENVATNKGMKDGAKAADLQAHSELADAHDAIYRHEEESAAHTFTKLEKMRFELAKSSEDAAQAEAKRAADQAEQQAREEQKALDKSAKDANDRAAKKAHEAQAAGDQIGAAFVNGLTDQLAKLAEGGEFDAAMFVSEILAAAVGVAGSIIGTAFGQPAVGAAIGNLAAMGIRAGGSAISKGNKSNAARTYHDGGWVDAPRHHSGAWIGSDEQRAILQTGERVLSRAEIHHAGGPAAVDNMARGGRGITLNVQAIDSKSVADTFAGPGGDGLKQALRRGHGALPALLGRGPR